MKRTLLVAATAVLALSGIVTAATAVAEPRCGFQGDWDCEGPPQYNGPLQNTWSHGWTSMPQICPGGAKHAALPVLRPAAMSDERRGGSGGFGGAFVLLIFVGAIVKFWVWIVGRVRRRGGVWVAVVGGVL